MRRRSLWISARVVSTCLIGSFILCQRTYYISNILYWTYICYNSCFLHSWESIEKTGRLDINMEFYREKKMFSGLYFLPNEEMLMVLGNSIESCYVSHVCWLTGFGQFKFPYFLTDNVTEIDKAVVCAHRTPRRLCFPAPLFSLAGGLSQKEAVLTQGTQSTVRNSENSERRNKNSILTLRVCWIHRRQQKSCFSVLLMQPLLWEAARTCGPGFSYQNCETRRLCLLFGSASIP